MKKTMALLACAALMLSATACSPKPAADQASPAAEAPAQPNTEESKEDIVVDEVGEKLIPTNADRTAVSDGNLTLTVKDSLENVKTFYATALDSIGATGEDKTQEKNAALAEGEAALLWSWDGSYDTGKPVTIDVTEGSDESECVVIVTYAPQEAVND